MTGVGLLTPLGIGTEASWEAISRPADAASGRSPQFDATAFSCRIAGEVKGFDPASYIEKKEIKKMGRFIQFAIAAADCALQDSGLKVTPEIAEEVGVYIGSGIGGFEVIEREHQTLLEHGPRRISPFFIPATIINLASGYVSIRSGAKGPNSATATACTTSAHSIGDSFRMIQRGDADRDDLRRHGSVHHADGHRRICRDARAFARAMTSRSGRRVPGISDRDGFVVGEGAGILVLEELEFAQGARRATSWPKWWATG